jgi:hypothetical protein
MNHPPAVIHMTGSYFLPKRVLRALRSIASSFNFRFKVFACCQSLDRWKRLTLTAWTVRWCCWKHGFFLFTSKQSLTMKYINDVIDKILQAGIYMQFKKRCVNSVKLAKRENISNIVYWYIYINVTHMQAAFCILLLGYALAVVCMVMDITWYHLVSKGRVS